MSSYTDQFEFEVEKIYYIDLREYQQSFFWEINECNFWSQAADLRSNKVSNFSKFQLTDTKLT